MEDLASLGCRFPDVLTRVSEYITEIIDYCKKIIENGMAYHANGSVYFDTQSFQVAQSLLQRLAAHFLSVFPFLSPFPSAPFSTSYICALLSLVLSPLPLHPPPPKIPVSAHSCFWHAAAVSPPRSSSPLSGCPLTHRKPVTCMGSSIPGQLAVRSWLLSRRQTS